MAFLDPCERYDDWVFGSGCPIVEEAIGKVLPTVKGIKLTDDIRIFGILVEAQITTVVNNIEKLNWESLA